MTGHETDWVLDHGDALDRYSEWARPSLIISDGAYGIGGFHGDPPTVDRLPDWYEPHIVAWSAASTATTSLWFWNTEVGWATVHPVLIANGWEYIQTITWDKGIAHAAGRVNSNTIRQFPVVTEIAVLYRQQLTFPTAEGEPLSAREWLRAEWARSGLPMRLANEACNAKSVATRKYLALDHQWYFPPGPMVEAMSRYLAEHAPEGAPYLVIDGHQASADSWEDLRPVWNHTHGITNVWTRPPLTGAERYQGSERKNAPRSGAGTSRSATHLNQKPLEFMERQINATTREGDVIWEPFGGLVSASVAAVRLNRFPYAAEIDPTHHRLATERLTRIGTEPCQTSLPL